MIDLTGLKDLRGLLNSRLGMQFDLLGKSCIPLAVQLRANKHTEVINLPTLMTCEVFSEEK